MARYPIKMLKDENNNPFVPLVSTECVKDPGGQSLDQKLANYYTKSQTYTKSEVDALIPTQTILTDTLTAGNTTLTFTDSSILTSSLIDVYTDTFGVNPTNMTSSTGELILTFPAQTDDVDVKVVIR